MNKFKLSLRVLVLLICFVFVGSTYAQSRKSVSILGDSYSTFENYLQPDTNFVWYFKKPIAGTDVTKVTETWWHKFITERGYKLCVNNSFSGSTICNTGYKKEDVTRNSFIARMNKLGCPDIIFIFGGTNDAWAKSPIGEYKYDKWTKADLYNFRPAMAYMLSDMKDRYPNVDIYFILNSELAEDINESVRTICKYYNVPLIELHDIDKISGHPSVKGMAAITEQLKKAVKK
ncbi:MAG: SGNH/GDSL hydrolase family protein [Bacteroidaceae bacterium]|nr:hypothetical protein [Bacteroidaceae bacterium]MCR4770657.1 SGNH/GDSL hydrolase family protein [Bacteroidaceae bacterium]